MDTIAIEKKSILTENKTKLGNAILLTSCALQKGIAATLTQFVHNLGAEIINYDQYVDADKNRFYCRMEWSSADIELSQNEVEKKFENLVANPFNLDWTVRFKNEPVRIAVFVSKEIAHLYSLITRCISGQWNATIPLIISNHPHIRKDADRFNIKFHHLPIDKQNKQQQENRQLALLKENKIDVVVLARYMQIVSGTIIRPYKNRIINIHHSMLPAFAGAKPYHQAHARGVKLIGATSHYVTEELDAGPIIAQDVNHIEHRNTIKQLVNLGRDLETTVLTNAVGLHIDSRIMVSDSRTILFN